MTSSDLTALHSAAVAARAHHTATVLDLQYASTRVEQIRLSRLSAEADRIASSLEELYNAVYFSMSPQQDLTA